MGVGGSGLAKAHNANPLTYAGRLRGEHPSIFFFRSSARNNTTMKPLSPFTFLMQVVEHVLSVPYDWEL